MPRIICYDCSRQFRSVDALSNHCYSTSHTIGCGSCNRRFYYANSLIQHRQDSPAHAPKARKRKAKTVQGRTFNCLFCGAGFSSPSAVAQHIESGIHRVTRHHVTEAVHKLNIIPTISINRRLEGPAPPTTKVITYHPTKSSFNGNAFECWLCCKTFRSLARLSAHLNSAAHDINQFKCPKVGCERGFKLVSGLIQHLESGACGLAKFKQIGGFFHRLTGRFSRAITY